MREQWRTEAAFAVAPPFAPSFGRRRERWRDIELIVDLAEEPLSGLWWRGVATLSALCALVAVLAPAPFEPLPVANAEQVGAAEAERYDEVAISPLGSGSETGVRMAANALVEPLAEAPDRPSIELFARLGSGDTVEQLLTRSGVGYAEAGEAARLISSVPGIRPGTSFSIKLGRRSPSGLRPIERIAFRAGLDRNVTLTSAADGLQLAVAGIAVDTRPLRIRGRVGDGLYWALRASGVSPQAAGEYLRAIGAQLDVGGEIGPDDRFDLIVANRRAATGESQEGPLLYAAIDRAGAADIRLMKWNVGGRIDWVDANGAGRQVAAFAWPVAGRITSGFGLRVHPILRFARMHRGIDFGAGYGAPIVAASDGQVIGAGWSGGYGRQVRIAHGGGIVTSYSHMSRTVAEPGSFVRQGQLIGYVGSSGLSTGPHLHYEVYRNGTAVNPLGVKFTSSALLQGPELERFKAHLAKLMSIGTKSAPNG
ncbi:MAG: M23 family metallopeptidase [Pseudomonadota bacterium]|nr:M23 family metallopeptidase [Pseudomonadota bacterium]